MTDREIYVGDNLKKLLGIKKRLPRSLHCRNRRRDTAAYEEKFYGTIYESQEGLFVDKMG